MTNKASRFSRQESSSGGAKLIGPRGITDSMAPNGTVPILPFLKLLLMHILLSFLPATVAFTPSSLKPIKFKNRSAGHGRTNGGDRSTPVPLLMNKKGSSSGGTKRKNKGNRAKPKGFAGALRDLQMASFQYSGTVLPGKQTPQRVVKEPSIPLPDYALDGMPKNKGVMLPWLIEVKTPEQIEKMRAAGRAAREVLDIAGQAVRPGITTEEIDVIVHEEALKRGAYPSPLNYHGFPKSCCTSVNEVICHGIPDDRRLLNGDLINIDITVYLDGYHGDCSEMFFAGDLNRKGRKLLQATYDCWVSAMEFVEPGKDYKDIGSIIEDFVVERGYATVRNFCGHGIGSVFHTNPNIFHYRNSEPNGQMAAGHTFTIEPMICEGTAKCLMWPDQWTATTLDGKRSAQFEHTLLITPDGVEALTGKLPSSPVQFWEMESEVHKGVWLGTSANARAKAETLNKELLTSS